MILYSPGRTSLHLVPDMASADTEYSFIFNFEQVSAQCNVRSVLILSLQEFDHDSVSGWMEENWVSVCSWSSLLYLVMVVGGSAAMRDRSVSH